MSEGTPPDHYGTLQVSPHADFDTIERVFRHLAKRYHPDNSDTGDSDRFSEVAEAFRVLSDPEERARYDLHYGEVQEIRWKVFDQASANDGVRSDRQLRTGILTLLYTARRNDVEKPGLGILELERLLGCPEEIMRFHLWYLKERKYLQRLDNGTLAITVDGVDEVMKNGGPEAMPLLNSGPDPSERREAADGDAEREAHPAGAAAEPEDRLADWM
jgi:hypothetical protein